MHVLMSVASVGPRQAQLERLLDSLAAFVPYPVVACLQDYPPNWSHPHLSEAVRVDEWLGPHDARMALFRRYQPNAWIVVDDDLEVFENTHYEAPLGRVMLDPACGLVSCNWARTETQARGKPLKDEWLRQHIVYTGGGLVLSGRLADEIEQAHPTADFACDNTAWSLVSYLNGRQNWRYRGSVAIHRIMQGTGRRDWMRLGPKTAPDARWVRLRPSTRFYGDATRDFHIPADRDLTPAARALHERNRTVLLGET